MIILSTPSYWMKQIYWKNITCMHTFIKKIKKKTFWWHIQKYKQLQFSHSPFHSCFLLHESNYSTPGGYSSLLLVGMCCWEFENGPIYMRQFTKKKWPIHIPFGLILSHILSKIIKFFPTFLNFEPNLAQIWENFGKLSHSHIKVCII